MKKKILSITILILILLCNLSVYATDEQTEIPSNYDLRNDISIKVENQGQKGWCNAYSTTKVIETYLQKTRGINYNLSEAYMAYSRVPYFNGDNNINTLFKDTKSVNYYPVQNMYKGYVLESDFPNKDYTFTKENKDIFDNVDIAVKSAKFKDLKGDIEVKKYIMNTGAVSLSICFDEKYYNQSTGAIYSNVQPDIDMSNLESYNDMVKAIYEYGFHSLIIIGWNDNYSRNNFKASNRPNSDGAWLVLNSWGTDWGNKGTAWISYEDVYVDEIEVKGIEHVSLTGELNANFSYISLSSSEFEEETQYVYNASITTDEEIEEIEGWIQTSNVLTDNGRIYKYNKTFDKAFEPYTIQIISKVDGATTTVNINIPEKFNSEETMEEDNIVVKRIKMVIQDICPILIVIIIFILPIIIIKKIISVPSKKNKKTSKNKSNK